MIANKSTINLGEGLLSSADSNNSLFFQCQECKEFTLEIPKELYEEAKEIKESKEFKEALHYSKTILKELKKKSFKEDLKKLEEKLKTIKNYEDWTEEDFTEFGDTLRKNKLISKHIKVTETAKIWSYMKDLITRFLEHNPNERGFMGRLKGNPQEMNPEQAMINVSRFFNNSNETIGYRLRNFLRRKEDGKGLIEKEIEDLKYFLGLIKVLSKEEREVATFSELRERFYISHEKNVCKCCNKKFEVSRLKRNNIGIFFKKHTISESEDTIKLNVVFERFHQYRKAKTLKIVSFIDSVSILFSFNVKTGQSYMIKPAILTEGKEKYLGTPIRNITFSGYSYLDTLFEQYSHVVEDIPKEVINEVFEKIKEKRDDKEEGKGDVIDSIHKLCLYNRHPLFINPKMTNYNSRSLSKLFRGYLPKDESFAFLGEFKEKKSIRKEVLKDFRKVQILHVFNVKDVNNALKFLRNQYLEEAIKNNSFSYDRKKARLLLRDMTNILGETTAVNKLLSFSDKMYILNDTTHLYSQYKGYLKRDFSKKEQEAEIKNLFIGRNLKEIHDELSLRIGRLRHENRKIEYKDPITEGIFGEVHFKYPKETVEIVTAGNIMSICVGSDYYINRVLERKQDVVIGYNKSNLPVVCIEILRGRNQDEILQVKGIRNSIISHENLKSFSMWIESLSKKTVSNTGDILLEASWNKLEKKFQKSLEEINKEMEDEEKRRGRRNLGHAMNAGPVNNYFDDDLPF